MYAIVEIAGLQYKVAQKQRVFVHRLEASEGTSVEFDKVLLIENDGKVTVGSPVIDGARVAAKVISHLKDEKVIVFKKKRRKGYQKWNNHRQSLTELVIQGILTKGEKLSADDAKIEIASIRELKAASLPKPKAKTAANTSDLEEETPEAKPAKKTAAKKPAAKKPAAAKGEKKAPAKKASKKKED